MSEERLQKVLAAAGVASRRGADAMIGEGRVTVDGVVAVLGQKVDPARQQIAVDGKPIPRVGAPVYLVLNKPVGVTTTVLDKHAERTVMDLVPRTMVPPDTRLFPVGRLDRDSEGLVLLTNDGAWAERVLHPRYGVEREYAAGLGQPLQPKAAAELAQGIELEEGIARFTHLRPATPSETKALGPGPDLAWYRVTLEQGWNRQVRRMFGQVGFPVVRLARVRIGTLRLAGLKPGEIRPLTPAEVRSLGRGVVKREGILEG